MSSALPQDRPPLDRPKFALFFSLARHNFHYFFPLLGVSSHRLTLRGPPFGAVVLDFGQFDFGQNSCHNQGGRGRRQIENASERVCCFGAAGASHDNPRTPNVNISGPPRFKHHQNSTRRPPREGRMKENCGVRRKKSAKFWASHPAGPRLWPIHSWPIHCCVLCCCVLLCVVCCCCVLLLCVGVGFEPAGSPLAPDPPADPLRRTAQNFPLFCLSLGVFSWNFGAVFEGRDPQMCTFGLSDCHVKPRRLRGRRGFTQQPENSKRAHLIAPALQTPPKFTEKTSRDRQKE